MKIWESNNRGKRNLMTQAAILALTAGLAINPAPATAAQASAISFNIESQPLADALMRLSRQAGVDIAAPSSLTRGRRAPAVSGAMTTEQALQRLLAGSGLSFRAGRGNSYVVESEALGSADASSVQAVDAPPSEGESDEEIVITGSRIGVDPGATERPVVTVGQEAVVDRGLINVAEALNSLPQIGVPEGQRGSQDESPGRNYLNIFGLGSQRTLTLVNSRRFVSNNPGGRSGANGGATGTQVDLNNIPVLLIDRIELVQATGAATYGADAIAGVANVILKKDFVGLIADAQAGISERGDYFNYSLRALAGHSFNEGRGNITVSFERTENDPLFARQRPFSRSIATLVGNALNTGPSDGIPGNIVAPDWRLPTATAGGQPQANGAFIMIPGPNGPVPSQFAPDGTLIPFDLGKSYFSASGAFNTVIASGGDGLNLSENNNLYSPVKRDLAYALGSYDLTDNIRFSTELTATWLKGRELANQSTFLNVSVLGTAIPVTVDNPFLSDQARAILQGQGITNFVVSRGNNDVSLSPRLSESRVRRAVFALDGDFQIGERDFFWNAMANFGEAKGSMTYEGIVQSRFLNAINAVRNGAGEIVCAINADASTTNNDANCRPFNPFGLGAPSAESIDYITTELQSRYKLTQKNFQANIGGELVRLPGGMLEFAAGYEYRREGSKFDVNEAARLGISREVAVVPVAGSYHTNELYGELSVPLVGGDFTLPGIQELVLTGAIRFVDNSRAGEDKAWNVGARWTVVDGLLFRGSYSRTFRAPSVVELFAPRSSFTQSLGGADICDAQFINLGPNPAARQANCQAMFVALGLPANFQLASARNTTAVLQTRGGNPNLENEIADSWTAGVVIEPRMLRGLSLQADYVSISIENGITNFGAGAIFQGCFDADNPDPAICGLIERDANAQVTGVTTGIVNAAFTNFRGVSAALNYRLDLPDEQRITVGLNVFHNIKVETSVSGLGFDLNTDDGEISAPKWRASARLGYKRGPFQLNWFTNYVSGANFNNNNTVETQFPLRVGAVFRHDVSASFEVNENYSFRLGMNNVFDRQPGPLAVGQGLGGGYYDAIGRAFFAGARVRF